MALAFELKLDDDEVAQWPVGKLVRWNKFFERKNKREQEALKKAQREADKKSTRR